MTNFSLVKESVVLMFVLALAACAADPLVTPAGRTEEEKSGFNVEERLEVDASVHADFDTAMKHLKAGEYEEGANLMKKVTQRSPSQTAPHINLAIAYHQMGNLPAAEESVKKALALDSEHPVANTEYGLICRKTGKFAEARQAYEKTLKRYPGFLPARKNLGILCDVYLRDLECALTHYQLYSAAAPDDKAVQLWIADLQKRMGKAEQ